MIKLEDIQFTSQEKEVNFNDDTIKVKQYLSIEHKIALVQSIVNNSVDNNNYYNPIQLRVFYTLGIINEYTDIVPSEDGIFEAYDKIVNSGIFKAVEEAVPIEELDFIKENIAKLIENIYNYNNSIHGIMDAFKEDSKELDIDVDKIQQTVKDPEALKLLKTITGLI